MESLDVYLNDRKVGRLDDENGSFTRMAAKVGVSEKMMRREIAKIARRVRREAPVVARRCQRKWPSSVYSAIEAGIADRLDQLSE